VTTSPRPPDTPQEALAAELDREPAYWEPWTPKPGDRVRVRVNAECLYCVDIRFPECYERALADDDRMATVSSVGHDDCSCRYVDEPPDPAHMAHDVWVKWDERRPYDDPVPRVGEWECPFDAHFAACELEPLP
jgi:hypothetical protein